MSNEIFLNVKVIPNSKEFKVTGFDPTTQTLKAKVKANLQKDLQTNNLKKSYQSFFQAKQKLFLEQKAIGKKFW